ncbi:hypothetical protein CAL29_10590 [Bordetella genomosp. 10]|uniref:ChsH2 C-terminal OB-fold domain-containing protein n=1 Tax=Bordetella genomosp. 10 TaxID=1416804 RepID=A0A261SB45_9BORD|nr:OB-fold domain-containing protein [Bordetella genomosp. 10]OZI34000.1 hypothetical protein CAL29_10590 [Bordetella genomosp. 10]
MTQRHPLDMQRCADCGAWWALRPYACAACGGTSLAWTRASGEGVVTACSVVHRAPDAAWREYAPYTLVLVRLREGPVLMGHAAPGVAVGDAVAGQVWAHGQHLLLRFEARRPP